MIFRLLISKMQTLTMLPLIIMALPSLSYAQVFEISTNGEMINVSNVSKSLKNSKDKRPYKNEIINEKISYSPMPEAWNDLFIMVAKKNNIDPILLEALVYQESRWNPSAVSPKGAIGLTQLMPATAMELGVNPYDPLENLDGGARYLRIQLDKFNGDINLALAAYNAGEGRVRRAGGVPPIRETIEYVNSIKSRIINAK